ncbi:uncharacterized protein LOC119093054, partial [Pollicipes pollicipes]|uniref:uncharacterized protein LOC119093054 n=1 Tax=Pollicipes pollicipes TaxID=41117 RepID=UPI00188524F5
MKVYCAIEECPHHAASSDAVGLVEFPTSAGQLRVWRALTGVRHVVRGVTRLCTDHFTPADLEPDAQWERLYPGQVNPKPRLRPGVVPSRGVPGWLEESLAVAPLAPVEPPSMFVRQEGSGARRVRPSARLQDAHPILFDDPLPAPRARGGGAAPGGKRPRVERDAVEEDEELRPAAKLPPNTSQRFREVLAKQRELQQLEKHRLFEEKLRDIFTPAQLKMVQNKSQRMHMWDTLDIKRAIGLRRLCTRRAYAYVKEVLRVPLPGLAVLRGSSQRDPETQRMYQEM